MNKTYHVYGIGNALVDAEFAVDDQFFAHESIQKGIMTLVDGESQETILDRLQKHYQQRKRSGGGSAANTIYAICQFGGKTFYSCKVANDEPGDFYLQELGDHNIHTNLGNNTREDGVTGKCLVMVSPDAERTMLSYLGISETLSKDDVVPEAVKDSEYLYLEGYLVTSPTGREACIHAKQLAEENGVKTALTLSDPSMVQYFRGGLEEMIGSGVDLLFCNDVEAKTWTGEDDIQDAADKLKQIARSFAITLGAQGALLFDGEQYIKVAPHKVKALDTNGAGDMFAGAFLYGVSAGYDFATAGRLASVAPATLVQTFGPRLSPQQHQEVLRKVLEEEAAAAK